MTNKFSRFVLGLTATSFALSSCTHTFQQRTPASASYSEESTRPDGWLNRGENQAADQMLTMPEVFSKPASDASKKGQAVDVGRGQSKAASDGMSSADQQTLKQYHGLKGPFIKQGDVLVSPKSQRGRALSKQKNTAKPSEYVRRNENSMQSKLTTSAFGANRKLAVLAPNETSASLAQYQRGAAKANLVSPPTPRQKTTKEPNKKAIPITEGSSFVQVEQAKIFAGTPGEGTTKPRPKSAAQAKFFDDSYEPNDFRSSAYSLSSYDDYWLSEIYGSGVQYDDDYYSMYLRSGDRVEFDLRFIDNDGDIDLQIIDSSGSVVASSASTSNDEYIVIEVLRSGTFYARIYYGDRGNSYDFRWRSLRYGGTLSDDDYEQNDSIFSAYDLVAYENRWLSSVRGIGVAADSDFYEVEVEPQFRRLRVDLRFDHYTPGGDIDVEVQDSFGRVIPGCRGTSSSDDEYIDCDLRSYPAGAYFIRVYPFSSCSLSGSSSSGQCNTYDMLYRTERTSTPVAEDTFEPNDSRLSARSIQLNQTYLNLAQYDEDWFEINVPDTSRELRIEADFQHLDGDIDLELRDANGTLLRNALSTSDDEFISYTVPLNSYTASTRSARLYIRVFGANAGNRYSLRTSTTSTSGVEDEYEDNDTPFSISGNANLSNREGTWISNVRGLGLQRDEDYFFLGKPSALGRFTIDLRSSTLSGDVNIQLYGIPDGSNQLPRLIATSEGPFNDEIIDTSVRPDWNYVVRVYGDNTGVAYDLRWTANYRVTRMRHAADGAYYNPTTSGQGILFNYIDGRPENGTEQGVIGWYMYHPFEGFANGSAPFWFTGQGRVQGDSVRMSIFMTRGGSFNACVPVAGYPSSCSAPVLQVGTGEFKMTGCGTATFSYDVTFPGGPGIRKVETQQLTMLGVKTIDGRDVCTGAPSNLNLPANSQPNVSGVWYDPATSGQGFFVDQVQGGDGSVRFAGWYTYAPTSQPGTEGPRSWATIASNPGRTSEGVIRTPISDRPRFNSPPALVESDFAQIGTVRWTNETCNSMTLEMTSDLLWSQPSALPAGRTINLRRIGLVPYLEYMDGSNYVRTPYCQ